MESLIKVIKENPIIIGVFAVIAVLIATRGSARGDNGMSATLSSQQIATNAAVNLAGIQAQREATTSTERIAAINAKARIIEGAQNLMIADKQIGAELAGQAMNQATMMSGDSSAFLSDVMNMVGGYKVAERNAVLDAQRLVAEKELGLATLSTQRAIGTLPFDIQKLQNQITDLTQARQLNYDMFALPLELNQEWALNRDNNATSLAMLIEREATARNLAWRAKQIASNQMLGGLLNTISGGMLNIGSQIVSNQRVLQ